MVPNFSLWHTRKQEKGAPLPALISSGDDGLVWETCLRRIRFCFGPLGDVSVERQSNSQDAELLSGRAAYIFLLEIISGLHSPVVGETEVMGQFRDFVRGLNGEDLETTRLKEIAQLVCEDAKRVREQYLLGLGHQSYGSVARRWLKGEERVMIIGTGQLAQESAEWLQGAAQVVLLSRNPERAQAQLPPGLAVLPLSSMKTYASQDPISLIIAAPFSAETLHELADTRRFNKVVDFRDVSTSDPLSLGESLHTLADVFAEFSQRKAELENRISQAKQGIEERAQKRWDGRQQNRPFGWEDVCA